MCLERLLLGQTWFQSSCWKVVAGSSRPIFAATQQMQLCLNSFEIENTHNSSTRSLLCENQGTKSFGATQLKEDMGPILCTNPWLLWNHTALETSRRVKLGHWQRSFSVGRKFICDDEARLTGFVTVELQKLGSDGEHMPTNFKTKIIKLQNGIQKGHTGTWTPQTSFKQGQRQLAFTRALKSFGACREESITGALLFMVLLLILVFGWLSHYEMKIDRAFPSLRKWGAKVMHIWFLGALLED